MQLDVPLNAVNSLAQDASLDIHTMDIEGFLLASGFALLVVLLGWASQITSKTKETKDLEAQFLERAKVKKDDYKKIVNDGGATKDSFAALVGFIYNNKEEHLQIFDRINNIKGNLEKLDRKYNWRFWLLIWMSISFFLTGIMAFFFLSKYDIWLLAPNGIFIILVFANLINTHNLEKRYAQDISDAMEKL